MMTLFTGEILLHLSHFYNTSVQNSLYVQSLFFILAKYTLHKICHRNHFLSVGHVV